MIKNRYLMMLSVAAVSIMLGSLFYNNVTIADRAREPTPVEITNLPLDEQGNLKVVNVPRTKIVTVCENTRVSMSEEPILLGVVDFVGYTWVHVFVKSEAVESQPVAASYIIRLYLAVNDISTWSTHYMNIYDPPYTTHYSNALHAPTIEFYAEQGSGWASITVIAYLVSD